MNVENSIIVSDIAPRPQSGIRNLIYTKRWFFLIVVIPVLLTAIYFAFIASDEFVSESSFVIKSPSQRSAQVSTLANLIQTTALSGGQEQANEVTDYILSHSALGGLQRQMPIKAIYSNPDIDWLTRYPGPFRARAQDNLFHYYRDHVEAGLDHESGLVVLRVKAYRPQDAQNINLHLLRLSEDLVNQLNIRARSKEIAEGEARVAGAEDRVRRARLALAGYRNAHELVDPGKQTSGVLEISNKLLAEQTALQAQLNSMLQIAPQNPAIPAIRSRIQAVAAQVGAQSGRAVGTSGGIASQLSGYDALALEQDFAAQNMIAASAALESSRADAVKQQYYLERVVEPDLPDIAEYPKRLRAILTVLGSVLVLYFIGWMFITGILEHAPEG